MADASRVMIDRRTGIETGAKRARTPAVRDLADAPIPAFQIIPG
jgi:hypothetical protein